MTKLIDLSEVRRTAKRQRVNFTRAELRALLEVYSRRVVTGEWKDYAVDQHGPIAVFSVFRNSFETPVYAIVKRGGVKGCEYLVMSGRRIHARSRTLSESLKMFERPLYLVPSA